MNYEYIYSLEDQRASLDTVGGKGVSLARLLRAGLPVPGGFYVTTAAYREFVTANNLPAFIRDALKEVNFSDTSALETASQAIRARFISAPIPQKIALEVQSAYRSFLGNETPAAVRSSATAEDLPEASFAGQQDTYLNIHEAERILEAVRNCWASLWTGRAVGYREKNHIDQSTVALAVVVQKMILADVSGIMFSANPLNGDRQEIVINAAWGLGESIVGGQVTPDTYIVDKKKGRVIRHEISGKAVMTVPDDQGTLVIPVPDSLKKKAALSNKQARVLARYACQIEERYGQPVDIEWTMSAGSCSIVQARPITSLPPEFKPPKPKVMYARGSFAEFLPDPVSPLFATLAVPMAQQATVTMMNEFLGINNPGNYQFEVINGYIFVGIPSTWDVMFPFIMATLTQSKKILTTATERWKIIREKYSQLTSHWREQDLSQLPAVQLIAGVKEIFQVTAEYYTVAQSGTLPNASSSEIAFSRFYKTFVQRKGEPEGETLLFGLESQPLRAEKSLYDIAVWLSGQKKLAQAVKEMSSGQVVAMLGQPVEDPAWNEFRSRLDRYLEEYGHVIFDMDFARPLPVDQPATLVDALKAYLEGTGNDPYKRQSQAEILREKTVAECTRRLDPLRRKWFLKLFNWAVKAAPLREDSIADIGLGYPQIRRLLGELGKRLAERQAFGSALDVYWLEAGELDTQAQKLDEGLAPDNFSPLVESRKKYWQDMRRVIPPATLTKNAWFGSLLPRSDQAGDVIKGVGASAGKVTAPACIMLGPEDFKKMAPGHVIVAVTTTPAWTPLFTLASAIVTDIGGPLSHSSIVAREYGIPAVLATGVATRRIKDGQLISVDGSAGLVSINGGKI